MLAPSLKSSHRTSFRSHDLVALNSTTPIRHPAQRSVGRNAALGSNGVAGRVSDQDLEYIRKAAVAADSSAGDTQPHPNAACVLVSPSGQPITTSYLRAQGTQAPEVQAVQQARDAAAGSTAYLNLESGDCHGDDSAVEALIQANVSRVVIGIPHPLPHLRGQAINALRSKGIRVDVLSDTAAASTSGRTAEAAEWGTTTDPTQAALQECLRVNEALLHRALLRRPMSILKYAMTLDGKIATSMGHSAWVSSAESRGRVFEMRARSDAVIVGGNTVRRDNPRLTTRREGGHTPVRIVMSRTLDLPESANLWDVTLAPTIVMTQRGARQHFQAMLQKKGVEVVEFDFLTPDNVADYCYERGFLQCFWECGGTLAAPTIASGVIHKLMAFVAPKIIGGIRAPTPVGELGFVEMTQAVNLAETQWQQVGPDLLMTGYLPSSGGPTALHDLILQSTRPSPGHPSSSQPAPSHTPPPSPTMRPPAPHPAAKRGRSEGLEVVSFYKAWDRWGALSNFSPHHVTMPDPASGSSRTWPSVEHYYQAHKFQGSLHPESVEVVEAIAAAASPEEAARIGRRAQRTQPHLMRPDWDAAKVGVMYDGLRAKFSSHAGPRKMLLSTLALGGEQGAAELVESSPHDYFWGSGIDGQGKNQLGKLLMRLRGELGGVERSGVTVGLTAEAFVERLDGLQAAAAAGM